MSKKICVYCKNEYLKNTEHVFPFGLGGANEYMNCVCEKCNNLFSSLERELYQKSFVGLVRSIEGIEGYTSNATNPAPFKAPILLAFDNANKIVFEVSQHAQMKVSLRCQMYYFEEKYFIEADTLENRNLFSKVFSKWKTNNCYLQGYLNNEIIISKFILENDRYRKQPLSDAKNTKGAIHFCTLPSGHKLYNYLNPRIYLDDDKGLMVRARTFEEAESFVEHLLNDVKVNNQYGSLPGLNLDSPTIDVGFNFNAVKFERALVKIGLNCLFHHFPTSVNDPALIPCINYVNGKTTVITSQLNAKIDLIDFGCDNHNIFFNQHQNGISVRVSLFNGQFVFLFWIYNLNLLNVSSYARLLIDYRRRTNIFQNRKEFLSSFK